jgi:uncharacterized protein YkwD
MTVVRLQRIGLAFTALSVLLMIFIGAATATHADANSYLQKHTAIGHTSSEGSAEGSLIAPPSVCPAKGRAPAMASEEQTMLCLVNYARSVAGLPTLSLQLELEESSAEKSRDMLACDDFSHFACGREFSYWIRASGYLSVPCWHCGENIAWGRDAEGSARSIFIAFMHSELHRHNILGDYSSIGIDTRIGDLGWLGTVQVWTQHFGYRC